jgi:hypothetical protein
MPDPELDRLFEEAQAADRAFREFRLSRYAVRYTGSEGSIGTASATDNFTPESRRRHDELRDASKRAHDAWLNYRPHGG